jgi:hypothetical protein
MKKNTMIKLQGSDSRSINQMQLDSNEPTMTKNSKTIVFLWSFSFSHKKRLLGLNLLQYVTKNTYNFFNTSHFLY